MFDTLRRRLILSHIIPLIIVVPFLFMALSYVFETRFIIPQLSQELFKDAHLLSDIARLDYLTTGDQRSLQLYLLQLQPNPQIRLVYLSPQGTVMYSNDPDFVNQIGKQIQVPGFDSAKQGQDVLQTNHSLLPGTLTSISVLTPVTVRNNQVIGILWMTYYEASLNQIFQQMRWLSILIAIASLFFGALVGSILAVNIGRPIRKVTDAISSLASGERSEVLVEEGLQETRELAREVNVLVTRLHSLEQARRQLLANLVHELGRPLGALRSAIQALNRGANQDPQLFHELTTGMDEEAARLQGILNDLAHLHDQVLGPLELKLEPVALSEWLSRTLIPWQEAAIEKHVKWRLDIPSDLPHARIDQVRFAQIVGNLASNAVKYTPSGEEINISAGVENNRIWVRFCDSGPGIPLEEQKNIFKPFFQGSYAQRIKQGMGLGLSIADDLIKAHDGTIDLESAPGKGSTFTVWIPAVRNDI